METRGFNIITGKYLDSEFGRLQKVEDEKDKKRVYGRKMKLYYSGNSYDILSGQDIINK